MKVLQKISSVLDSIFGFLVVIMIGAMVIITTAQIICRVWFTALSWSEEVTRFLLIWATFLGATCVYRRSGNIAITAVQTMFPEKNTENPAHSRAPDLLLPVCSTALLRNTVLQQAGSHGGSAADQDEVYLYVSSHRTGCVHVSCSRDDAGGGYR